MTIYTSTTYLASLIHRCCWRQQQQQLDPKKHGQNSHRPPSQTCLDDDYANDAIRRQHFLWSILLVWFTILECHQYCYDFIVNDDDNTCSTSSFYDWTRSTEENYQSATDGLIFCGKYQQERNTLDYKYHGQYSCDRQLVQDEIIDRVLRRTVAEAEENNDDLDKQNKQHWIVFTAGIPGAGKTYTTQRLRQENKLPLVRQDVLVSIDPDELRQLLPEYDMYINNAPLRMGDFTQKEVGLLTELITTIALNGKLDVLVDGSLSNYAWYSEYINQLRTTYGRNNLSIGLIYVTASISTIFKRLDIRSNQTGRIVPRHVISRAIQRIPISIEQLQHHVDCFIEIENNDDNSIIGFNSTQCQSAVPPNDILIYP